MCDLISDVITFCVLSCDTSKINASDKIMFETNKTNKQERLKCLKWHSHCAGKSHGKDCLKRWLSKRLQPAC